MNKIKELLLKIDKITQNQKIIYIEKNLTTPIVNYYDNKINISYYHNNDFTMSIFFNDQIQQECYFFDRNFIDLNFIILKKKISFDIKTFYIQFDSMYNFQKKLTTINKDTKLHKEKYLKSYQFFTRNIYSNKKKIFNKLCKYVEDNIENILKEYILNII